MKANSAVKRICSKLLTPIAFSLTAGISLSGTAVQALTFKFNYSPDIDPRALAGFQTASDLWSDLLIDNVTVNLDIGYRALGSGVLGETGTTLYDRSYSVLRNALSLDATSTDDAIAVSNLQTGSALDMLINYTANNPNGSGSATPYFDNNNSNNNRLALLTGANAKALGLLPADNADSDGSIAFSSLFNFDFDRTDGIDADKYDFISVAAHEIGHALGFISSVDDIDYVAGFLKQTSQYSENDYLPTTADFFRFSSNSIQYGKSVIDLTAGSTDQYFSIDGGNTRIASFSTGQFLGDRRQASHWKDDILTGVYLGIMDPGYSSPVLSRTQPRFITNNDVMLFDVIGWDRRAVPEPSTVVGLMVLGAGLLLKGKRQSNC
ncbi:NF038122 family metalloprotease [Aerosakkonemataceae cyanobacterium BLCC-F50]|uniref:NF038122 family metalloprotease n=1 Tax=Floridaenema flaviceps BLCC-F50 TaxID=3153642 RepID=A0ABV4Y191_9CYAN